MPIIHTIYHAIASVVIWLDTINPLLALCYCLGVMILFFTGAVWLLLLYSNKRFAELERDAEIAEAMREVDK